MEFLVPLALGLSVGLLLGLTGAGGGLLAAPLLILVMHLPLAQAAPISLIAVFLGAGFGMLMGLLRGTVRYRAALLIALAGMLASPLGIQIARHLPDPLLAAAFVCLLLFQAWRLWRGAAVDSGENQVCAVSTSSGRFVWNRPCARALAGAGLMAGFLSGLLGVGGGFILVPALRRHTPLSMESISATSLMVLALLSLGGIVQWVSHGQIEWNIGLPFVAGAVLGMAGGRWWASRIDEGKSRHAFAVFCLLTGLAVAVKTLLALLG